MIHPVVTRAVILAQGSGPLVELCGITVLERLLRTLDRLGLRHATIRGDLPEAITRDLARGSSRVRPRLRVAVAPRRGPALLRELVPDADAALLVVAAGAVYDSRLLAAVLSAPELPATLVDSSRQDHSCSLRFEPDPRACGAAACALLVADACWLAGEGTLAEALASGLASGRVHPVDLVGLDPHITALRRSLRPFWFPAPSPSERHAAEQLLLRAAQKGVLDFPAILHAPIENFLVSRLWHTPITPNQLTLLTTLVAWGVTALFAAGRLGWGVLGALLVGVLDGLDGKLARVKVETSQFGELEHLLDFLYEFSWWAVLAMHFHRTAQVPAAFLLLGLLLAADLVERGVRRRVKRTTGRDLDTIAPVDRLLRLVGGRRNIYVWILGAGVLLGRAGESYVVLCLWGAVTAALHLTRAAWILSARRRR